MVFSWIHTPRRSDRQLGRLWRHTAGTDLRLVTGGVTAAVVLVIAAIAVDVTNFPGPVWAWQCASSAFALAELALLLLWAYRAPVTPPTDDRPGFPTVHPPDTQP